ncbi:MAG: glycoside hydrolase family 3 N-terminal domain-containing protein [Pseudomonadota bacterium]
MQGTTKISTNVENNLDSEIEQRVTALIGRMTLSEKIGQLNQLDASWGHPPDYLGPRIRDGGVGSILNTADPAIVAELQRIAIEESRLGIPLLTGRDVIHGFQTVMPIPLGQAASWHPALVQRASRASSAEASRAGINWTFAPMIDVTRDPRWGRVAESPGEDPYLAGEMAKALVRGVQGESLDDPESLAACAKHFAGYGAVEAGRDYAATNVPPNEMRNVHLRAFRAAVDAGAATVMTAFTDIDGVPATANEHLLSDVLRDEWGFDGMVVSDWDSVRQLEIHGFTDSEATSALAAFKAGVDMEMVGESYSRHLEAAIDGDATLLQRLDNAVANVLRLKFRMGLFDGRAAARGQTEWTAQAITEVSRELARASVVMLRNEKNTLPLEVDRLKSVAVLGPLADAPYQQLGTWIFDGVVDRSVTPLTALQDALKGSAEVRYDQVFETSRSRNLVNLSSAVNLATQSDVAIVFLGEEAILSGEAHCRADIRLPGAQEALVKALAACGTPLVGVILAGRPLALGAVAECFDALLYAWHPGSQAGPALADLLLGQASPSGKLPISFPVMSGQVPVYYSQKNTGKPATDDTIAHIDAIDSYAPQTSIGMTSYHLDAGFRPLYPFGFGLSYGTFVYAPTRLSASTMTGNDVLRVSTTVKNEGLRSGDEVVQLYLRDVAASLTRPVKELIGFQRVQLAPGESTDVVFEVAAKDLGFYGPRGRWVCEPGEFHIAIGGDSRVELSERFTYIEN